jgi:hypothetical protein
VTLSQGLPVPQDLLGILLTAADESGQAMTDEELWEDVHDVMGAGMLYMASNHANCQSACSCIPAMV